MASSFLLTRRARAALDARAHLLEQLLRPVAQRSFGGKARRQGRLRLGVELIGHRAALLRRNDRPRAGVPAELSSADALELDAPERRLRNGELELDAPGQEPKPADAFLLDDGP